MMKFFTKEYYLNKFIWPFFPELQYWYQTKKYYKKVTGKTLNYHHPRDLNEKLLWLNRYWRPKIKTTCTDKFTVRNYLIEKGLGEFLIPLIGVYKSADEIDFSALPSSFVLKCNHGSGCNVVCTDKNMLNIEETKQKLNIWLDTDYSKILWEVHYHDIPRKIICEKLLSKKAPIEYQFWCLNGTPESILVCRKNFDGTYEAVSYSLDYERLYDRKEEPIQSPFDTPPSNLYKMIELSKILSKDFPFVRVDLFDVNNKVYFAELTFTPAGNFFTTYKEKFLNRLGEKLVI